MITSLITDYVNAISLNETPGAGKLVSIARSAERQVAMLKQLTWHYVILNNDLATAQHGQREIVRQVFEVFYKAALHEEDWKLFRVFYQELLKENNEPARVVADYVSSMTESEIVVVHKKLTGFKSGPALS